MKTYFSILSKYNSLLGIQYDSKTGMKVNGDTNEITEITYATISIGIIFASITFEFVAHESKPIEQTDKMKSFIESMKSTLIKDKE